MDAILGFKFITYPGSNAGPACEIKNPNLLLPVPFHAVFILAVLKTLGNEAQTFLELAVVGRGEIAFQYVNSRSQGL